MKFVRQLPVLLAVLVFGAGAVFVAVNVFGASKPLDGPADVVWDREICAHCRMHIGEPAFAAQVQTGDGRVLNFDDPGCAFDYLERNELDARAVYFRHHREDRWIGSEGVGFVSVAQSPMGFGLAAVDVGAPAAIGLEEARRRVLRKD